MYLGFYPSQCTIKNQITFPTLFRKSVGKKLLITFWFDNSLMVVPLEKGSQVLDNLLANSSELLPEVRDLERFFYSNAAEVELDGQNRFVIPKHLKEYAGIKRKTVFVGVKERIELWDEEQWSNYGKIRELQIKQTARRLYEEIVKRKVTK